MSEIRKGGNPLTHAELERALACFAMSTPYPCRAGDGSVLYMEGYTDSIFLVTDGRPAYLPRIGNDSRIQVLVRCSEAFDGHADVERVTQQNLHILEASAAAIAFVGNYGEWVGLLFVARVRQKTPTDKYLQQIPTELHPLFSAAITYSRGGIPIGTRVLLGWDKRTDGTMNLYGQQRTHRGWDRVHVARMESYHNENRTQWIAKIDIGVHGWLYADSVSAPTRNHTLDLLLNRLSQRGWRGADRKLPITRLRVNGDF